MHPAWQGRVENSYGNPKIHTHDGRATRLRNIPPDSRDLGAPGESDDPPLLLQRKLGRGVYGTVYAASVGGEPLAVKMVPLIDDTIWRELIDPPLAADASPGQTVRHFRDWSRTMGIDANHPVDNAAVCEATFYQMADRVGRVTGAPWFVKYHGAFQLGTLDLKSPAEAVTTGTRARAAWVAGRRREFKTIVRQFSVRVPSVLICTDRCAESMWDVVKGLSDAPDDWALLHALTAQAACATLMLRSVGIVHNDFHLNNLMTIPTDRAELCVAASSGAWRVPTHGRLLKVVDFGLSTAPSATTGKRARTPPLLNGASLRAIRYRHDPDSDMRTLMLDLATTRGTVFPPPDSAEREAAEPPYRALAACVRLYTAAIDDLPGDRPWLLRLLSERTDLHHAAAEINRADGHGNSAEDDVFDSLPGSLLGVRRVANCRANAHRQARVASVDMLAALLAPFPAPGTDALLIRLPT